MKWPREWKPICFENSKVPLVLSKLAPIEIWAISLGPFVWCKGVLSEKIRNHETIHFQQQLELLFIGQWLLYLLAYLVGLVKHRSGAKAYRQNPFEQEAYDNDDNLDYLSERKRYSWIKKRI
jgi:hypothetical protein